MAMTGRIALMSPAEQSEFGRIGGRALAEQGKSPFQTADFSTRSAWGKKAWETRRARQTPEEIHAQASARARRNVELGVNSFQTATPAQRRAWQRKVRATWAAKNPEENRAARRENALRAWETRRRNDGSQDPEELHASRRESALRAWRTRRRNQGARARDPMEERT